MWSQVGVVLTLALSVSFDGLSVGASYGLRNVRLTLVSVLVISCLSAAMAALGMSGGFLVEQLVSSKFASAWGGVLFILAGTWVLLESWLEVAGGSFDNCKPRVITRIPIRCVGLVIQVLRDPSIMDMDRSGCIEAREAVFIGIVLGLDAMAVGLGAGIAGTSVLLPLVIGGTKCIFLKGGELIGKHYKRLVLHEKLNLVPALVLILLGVSRLV